MTNIYWKKNKSNLQWRRHEKNQNFSIVRRLPSKRGLEISSGGVRIRKIKRLPLSCTFILVATWKAGVERSQAFALRPCDSWRRSCCICGTVHCRDAKLLIEAKYFFVSLRSSKEENLCTWYFALLKPCHLCLRTLLGILRQVFRRQAWYPTIQTRPTRAPFFIMWARSCWLSRSYFTWCGYSWKLQTRARETGMMVSLTDRRKTSWLIGFFSYMFYCDGESRKSFYSFNN